MARKKQEIALQTELETQEEWEEALTKEGLLVIDVYQEWAGPCKSMIGNFRRMRNELSDNLLKFAMLLRYIRNGQVNPQPYSMCSKTAS